MNKIILLALIISSFTTQAQTDSISYYSVNTIGREIGTSNENINEFYLQLTYGIKFDKEFGVSAGAGFIYYENLGLVPILISIRKSPSNDHPLGFNFDLGYTVPLFSSTDDPQIENYSVAKGGTFFNPSLNILMYDRLFKSYLTIGYRVYSFTEEYENRFQFGTNSVISDKIIRRTLFLGVTFEF